MDARSYGLASLFIHDSSSAFASELPAQLTVKTSSSKKRKLARPPPSTKPEFGRPSSSSPDSVLPSCDRDDDPLLSSSADSIASRLECDASAARSLRTASLPASGLPPRLQTHASSLVSFDYASSVASSPCASAYAELCLESDRGGDEIGSADIAGRSQSPFSASRSLIMNGDAELPHRSSSPLKRRASSMDPDGADGADSKNASQETSASHGGQESNVSLNQLPRAMSVDAAPLNGHGAPLSQPPPPLPEQVKIIEMLLKAFADAPVEEGSVAYLVSRTWLDKALALRTGFKSEATGSDDPSPLGPVDNSDIVQEVIQDSSGKDFVRLVPGLGLESFELFPEDAWKLVLDWYGIKDGQPPITRTAVNTADSKQAPANIVYELHPPVFHVHRLWSNVSTIPIEQSLKARNPPPLLLARSSTVHAQTFLREIKTLAGVNMERKVRLFSVPATVQVTTTQEFDTSSALTPPDSPGRTQGNAATRAIWPTLLVDTVSFSQVRESRISVPLIDHTGNDKFNGQSTLRCYDLTTDQTLVLDEAIGNSHVSNYTGRLKAPEKTGVPRLAVSASSSKTNSNRSSPTPDGPMTRGRLQKKRHGKSIGAVGLHNLGNTCYMNSALQCVRSVEELTKYFLTESHIKEINRTNVLGFEGRVASAYGSLLHEIYEESRGSVSPRDFKATVGRCRPTFSGWSQQDSQEFLGFLLDALQEDLSRIKKKPYIEKPDSTDDMVNNPSAIKEMADKVWEITCRRDDSVIADLFTGLYKSTLKCPECGKISITFDPFNNLTLPLPLENMWSRSVKFFPLNDVPVRVDVELSKHSSIESLKQFVSEKTGVPVERLMGAEEFKDKFFKIYDNSQDVSEEIQNSDTPTIHELEAVPTNWPGKRPQKKLRSMLDIDTPPEAAAWDERECDTMVVPVLHRLPHTVGRGVEGVSPPHFITLTRKEATSYDVIQRKILQKVATFSTWSKFKNVQESDVSDGPDGDVVVTSSSDADSSGGSKIVTQSVEGEDDMVDIRIKESSHNSQNHCHTASPPSQAEAKILKHFNKEAPKWTNPDVFLNPELQNLFELCYFKNDSDGLVPTGWSNVDNTRSLPKLADRIPEASVKDAGDEGSPDSSNSAGSGIEESGEEAEEAEQGRISAESPSQTRMMDESSEENPQPVVKFCSPPGKHAAKLGPNGRKKFKGHRVYGKKAAKRREKQLQASKFAQRAMAIAPQPMSPAVADGGPLIRLFEGIVVDWTEDAWDTVFGNPVKLPDARQGSRTFLDLETLHDPALRLIQSRRVTRRTRGITLDECLDEFERAEVLSEQDMWYCPRCKEHRRASKKFDLWKTPDILVAHLKRFSSSGWRRDKLDVLVDFPIQGLDLTSRVIQKEDGKAEIYDLIAVDDHYGGLGGGHYTAYARNFVDERWYSYNDSSVHVVSDPKSVVTSAAYLLFYRRRSSGPLGGPKFREMFDKYDAEHSDNDASESPKHHPHSEVRTSVTQLSGLDDDEEEEDDDDRLASYGSNTIRRSIEEDGMYEAMRSKSLDMTQGWSFTNLEDKLGSGSGEADCGSDDAQFNSSGDDGERGLSEQDTDMASAGSSEHEQSTPWDNQGVLSVPADGAGDDVSDPVAEIHLEGDKAAQSH
ncbi:hypothetical protein E4U42_001645 [Claviceps africana]|uniref:ubiquitinyl hydrolase 1 n=1 Tax=Claviceps africana TaxID=83212 RepID=A0A8K0JF28_9HYPO|nr:hypothetical protein E4U42_001645 [Claviceps africana]